jgi:hypothetical protein
MSKLVKSIGAATGLYTPKVPGVGGIMLDKTPFDISKQATTAGNRLATLRNQSSVDLQSITPARSQALQQMGQAALGKGPSIAEEQMKQAQERSLAQQVAAAQAGSRGGTLGASQRQLAQNLSRSGQQIAQSAAQERIGERDRFLQVSGDERLNQSELIRQQLELDTAAQRTMQDFERAKSGAAAQQSQLMNANQQAGASRMGGLISGGLGAIFGSDETMKKDVKSNNKKVDSFLDQLKAREYNYKNPNEAGASKGKKSGIMAQDMEKSEIGRNIVKNVNGKKMISIPDSVSAVLAAQARLNERLNKLEKSKKKS